MDEIKISDLLKLYVDFPKCPVCIITQNVDGTALTVNFEEASEAINSNFESEIVKKFYIEIGYEKDEPDTIVFIV